MQSYGLPWCYRADARAAVARGAAVVINLDDRGAAGTHWTAARLIDGQLFYADPLGSIMGGWPPSELPWPAVVNRVAFQRPKSELCGYYAILFALAMDRMRRPLPRPVFEQLLYESIV